MMTYTRDTPYRAALLDRYRLNSATSDKFTYHLEIDLGDSGIQYRAGDSFGIYPSNSAETVDRILAYFPGKADACLCIESKNLQGTLRDLLTHNLNLRTVPKKLALLVPELEETCRDRALCKAHLEQFEVWDFLEHYQPDIDPHQLVNLLSAQLPRFYSIASAQQMVGSRVHLTVADVQYETRGIERRGVCTDFLIRQVEIGAPAIPLYLQPTKDFLLPDCPNQPIIMVGPGTGIAPFRAFIQQRASMNATGPQWLFFGERRRGCDFFYQDEWESSVQSGSLQLTTAFSRDQEEKVYVQHKMLEQGAELWKWLENGAHLYVCGDASRMAKDVEQALGQIAQEHGGVDPKDFIKDLRKQKRYLRDVY